MEREVRLEEIGKALQAAMAAHTAAVAGVRAGRARRRAGRAALADTGEARAHLQRLSAEVQQAAHSQIAEVVTMCFEAIFDDPYTFNLKFEEKRGRTEAVLTFERRGFAAPPLEATGGGTVDVAAFALRCAAVMLTRPAPRRLLVFDEPFRFLSERYRPRVRSLLEDLVDKLGLQVIMVTHDRELVTGKVVNIGAGQ